MLGLFSSMASRNMYFCFGNCFAIGSAISGREGFDDIIKSYFPSAVSAVSFVLHSD